MYQKRSRIWGMLQAILRRFLMSRLIRYRTIMLQVLRYTLR
jgi:hypothetical protein